MTSSDLIYHSFTALAQKCFHFTPQSPWSNTRIPRCLLIGEWGVMRLKITPCLVREGPCGRATRLCLRRTRFNFCPQIPNVVSGPFFSPPQNGLIKKPAVPRSHGNDKFVYRKSPLQSWLSQAASCVIVYLAIVLLQQQTAVFSVRALRCMKAYRE